LFLDSKIYSVLYYEHLEMNRLRSGIWNSTIKIPELKRPLPIVPSITAQDEAVDMMTDFMTKHKGGLLVVTGAGNVVYH
jgi:hypothetical protein